MQTAQTTPAADNVLDFVNCSVHFRCDSRSFSLQQHSKASKNITPRAKINNMRVSLWTCHSSPLALANKPQQSRSATTLSQNTRIISNHTLHAKRCHPLAAVQGGDDAPSTSTTTPDAAMSALPTPTKGDNTIADIEEVAGVRVIVDDDGNARAEYLVRWKVRAV